MLGQNVWFFNDLIESRPKKSQIRGPAPSEGSLDAVRAAGAARVTAQDSARVTVTPKEIHGNDQAGGVCWGELEKKKPGKATTVYPIKPGRFNRCISWLTNPKEF